jgi:AcrR family transcriptional regulator
MVDKIDRRTTDTKERIICEAMQLYKQGGIEAVKLNEITKALHVTRAALYNHFPEGKDQIFLEAFTSMVNELETKIAGIIESVPDTRQRLKEILQLASRTSSTIDLDVFFKNQEEFSQIVKDRMEGAIRPMLNQLIIILQEGMARGELRKVELPLAVISFGMLLKQVKQLERQPADMPPELRIQRETDVLIDQMLDLWFTGMANKLAQDCQS